jgi:photosystem II S4 domain protein
LPKANRVPPDDLIQAAERALRTWEPVWTGFLPAAVLEEATGRLATLSELDWMTAGGYGQAERRCLRLQRVELVGAEHPRDDPPLSGVQVSGNFLFDPASPADFRGGLLATGASEAELGDLWVRGDRGAQLVTTEALAARWHGHQARVRTVTVDLEAIPLLDLQPPVRPQPRLVHTVEASLRLDSVASAGFGVSRSRMAGWIRQGLIRVNWQVIESPGRELAPGDRIQLEHRGELTVVAVEATKRERWRLTLGRR